MAKTYAPMGMAGILGVSPEMSASKYKLNPKKVLIFIAVSIVFVKIVSTLLSVVSF